jgi:hypothetical protein
MAGKGPGTVLELHVTPVGAPQLRHCSLRDGFWATSFSNGEGRGTPKLAGAPVSTRALTGWGWGVLLPAIPAIVSVTLYLALISVPGRDAWLGHLPCMHQSPAALAPLAESSGH